MTKKEEKQLEELKTHLALKFYPKVEPDISHSGDYTNVVNGYTYNEYSRMVTKACTSANYHSSYQWDKTTSQGSLPLFSTQKKAYEAMLHDMALSFAKELRLVQKKYEECND